MKKDRPSGRKDKEAAALWEKVTRSVRPYKPVSPPDAAKKPAAVKKTAAPASHKPASPKPSVKSAPPGGFDRATETKLRRGRLELEARLDLHGMTQAAAYAALARFLESSVAAGKRTVLVITGKGRISEGVLRRCVPLWLEEEPFCRHVLSAAPAQPKDGGIGALYVRLRKKRGAR